MNYKLSEIADIVGGRWVGADPVVRSVATDSRNHCPDDALFVAIDGENHDAHQYINLLIHRGVQAFLVQHLPSDAPENIGFVVVNDSLDALQKLAAHHRSKYNGTVVAITGSNGKTIVKEWIAQLWTPQNGKLLRSPRSYNSQLGVPLSLLRIEGDEQLVVIEAGVSKPGEMVRLEAMIRPTIGIFTNLGPAHGENFACDTQKLAEKELLFQHVRHVIRAATQGTIEERNLSAVLGLYHYLGLPHKSLAELEPVALRLEVQEGILGSTIVNDSYNSDIASLAIALDFADRQTGSQRALILSDILQSSFSSIEIYSEVARLIQAHGITRFVGIGRALSENQALFTGIIQGEFYETTGQYLGKLKKSDFRDYVVLIKGSRPFGFELISAALESRTHTTVMEVDLGAMAGNLNYYRRQLRPGVRMMAMVKASGYGSGTVEVASMLQHQRVDYLAVAFADEGVTLRCGGIHLPIVVLNSDPGSFAVMIENNLEPEIYSFAALEEYAREARRQGVTSLPIHVKLDTGMHRLGFVEPEIEALNGVLSGQNTLYVSSIFSHLAASEDPAEDPFTRNQIMRFERMSSRIIAVQQNDQATPIMRHICNSAAIERFPEAHYDMVRLGIGLYSNGGNLHTVSRLYTKIVQTKELAIGDTVGYNRRGVVDTPKRIAIIPIGYADGLSRTFGCGAASFNVMGVLCPTIGNICMDTCMLDITDAPAAKAGDRVEIFGDAPTIQQLAAIRHTIPYEILTSVATRIRRVYISE